MMVLLLLLPLLNLNDEEKDVKISPDTVKIVTVTKKRRSHLILSYRIATLGIAQIAAVIHSIVMVVKNVGPADLVDFLDMAVVEKDVMVALRIVVLMKDLILS